MNEFDFHLEYSKIDWRRKFTRISELFFKIFIGNSFAFQKVRIVVFEIDEFEGMFDLKRNFY